jgi:hypothetical protein
MTTRPLRSGVMGVWRKLFGWAIAGVVVVVATCTKTSPVKERLTWQFACPDSTVSIRLARNDTVIDSLTDIPLSRGIANVPEYHDCQRFIDSSGGYGSVYAIFAAYRLRRLDSASVGEQLPVGTIYTPDGTYGALGIKPGFNCLYLTKSAGKWTALMVNRGQGRTAAACAGQDSTSSNPSTGQPLDVIMQVVGPVFPPHFGPRDYPPVARWDWDSVNGKQYIGIRCGAAWCEVGAHGFKPSRPYEGPTLVFDRTPAGALPARMTERVQRIKGWYDVQQLAAADDGSTQHPSSVRGILIPSPVLDTINWLGQALALKFYKNRWIHVAFAILDGDYGKWNFRRGTNKIFLCYGAEASSSCSIPALAHSDSPSTTLLNSCPQDPTDKTLHWWAKTVSATGDTTYSCVKRMDHLAQVGAFMGSLGPGAQYRIPGAARWRFLLNDESTWVSCPTGCCTKQ